ncbi:Zn-dependent protease with chaperone function [Microbispora rosea]|uniref:Zn-dependent protease with chaperone function n=1 Tax=Microbispora rosea TaxID=58117 RepID=A0A1N7HI54_9ACTN|nr:M48 family metallopeptidase [Microbispora rosea]SIS24557.1 Zn-dependent protease with chaperone function [Microbispora rosea]
MVIAGVVHLSTVALAAGSIWLIINGIFLARVFGVLGLMVAFSLRPRLGRFRRDEWSLGRAEAPRLYDLADRVADELGVAHADMIRVTPDYNATFGKRGLRRRTVLTIGLALWEVLSPQERVALLGHEFGHSSNGDSRRSLWLHSASAALVHWYKVTHPSRIVSAGSDLISTLASITAAALLFIPHKITSLILLSLHRLTLRSGQRAEYLADDLAARVASSAATRSMLEALALHESVETLLQRQTALHQKGGFYRALNQESDVDLWQELRDYIASVPQTERLRRLRVSALRMSSIDTTHPPTHLRIAMMDVRKPREAAIVMDEADIDAISAELSTARNQAARAVLTLRH